MCRLHGTASARLQNRTALAPFQTGGMHPCSPCRRGKASVRQRLSMARVLFAPRSPYRALSSRETCTVNNCAPRRVGRDPLHRFLFFFISLAHPPSAAKEKKPCHVFHVTTPPALLSPVLGCPYTAEPSACSQYNGISSGISGSYEHVCEFQLRRSTQKCPRCRRCRILTSLTMKHMDSFEFREKP